MQNGISKLVKKNSKFHNADKGADDKDDHKWLRKVESKEAVK